MLVAISNSYFGSWLAIDTQSIALLLAVLQFYQISPSVDRSLQCLLDRSIRSIRSIRRDRELLDGILGQIQAHEKYPPTPLARVFSRANMVKGRSRYFAT